MNSSGGGWGEQRVDGYRKEVGEGTWCGKE